MAGEAPVVVPNPKKKRFLQAEDTTTACKHATAEPQNI
jgi:hypothetical protein